MLPRRRGSSAVSVGVHLRELWRQFSLGVRMRSSIVGLYPTRKANLAFNVSCISELKQNFK